LPLAAGDGGRAAEMGEAWQAARHEFSRRHRPVDPGGEATRGLLAEAGKVAFHA